MISELRRGFEIGFHDRAAVSGHRHDRRDADDVDGHDDAAAVGLSLPVKILFFVLIDGWNLLIGSLVRSVDLRDRDRARASLAQALRVELAHATSRVS